jgi:transposase
MEKYGGGAIYAWTEPRITRGRPTSRQQPSRLERGWRISSRGMVQFVFALCFLNTDNDIAPLHYNRAANRDVLCKLARLNKPIPIYEANTIAVEYGLLLYYTPPYHPTLQPIELIWGLVKNRIAYNPPRKGADDVMKVLVGLQAVTNEEWFSRFRHVQGVENTFLAIEQ